jgi:Meiotically up-regulated gene 113
VSYGLTYVLRAGAQDLFKVGHTLTTVESRIQSLQTGCPWTLSVYKTIPSFFPDRLEKALQGMLRRYLTQGEWFAVPPETIDSMMSLPYLAQNPWQLHGDLSDGFTITPTSWARDTEGRVLLSSRCLCPSELEAEVLRLAQGLLDLLQAFPAHPEHPNFWRDHPFFKKERSWNIS